MTGPLFANSTALAMRRRHLRRKRMQTTATIVYRSVAAAGWLFIIAIVLGVLD